MKTNKVKQPTKKELLDKISYLEQSIKDSRERNAGFNKYKFVQDLEAEITAKIEAGQITDENGINEYIDTDIENAVIYYSEAFKIAIELNATHFEDDTFGMPTNISQHAYYALYEFVHGEIDMNALTELISEVENKES